MQKRCIRSQEKRHRHLFSHFPTTYIGKVTTLFGKHFEILRADEVDIVLNMNKDKEKNQDVPT